MMPLEVPLEGCPQALSCTCMDCTGHQQAQVSIRLSRRAKARALKYIQNCENGSNGQFVMDFEAQLWEYISWTQSRPLECQSCIYASQCENMFVKYVIVEVMLRNSIALVPPTTSVQNLVDGMLISSNRLECMCLHGKVNPKSFADIHYDTINQALSEVETFQCLPCGWYRRTFQWRCYEMWLKICNMFHILVWTLPYLVEHESRWLILLIVGTIMAGVVFVDSRHNLLDLVLKYRQGPPPAKAALLEGIVAFRCITFEWLGLGYQFAFFLFDFIAIMATCFLHSRNQSNLTNKRTH